MVSDRQGLMLGDGDDGIHDAVENKTRLVTAATCTHSWFQRATLVPDFTGTSRSGPGVRWNQIFINRPDASAKRCL